jgi:hypothetical protein
MADMQLAGDLFTEGGVGKSMFASFIGDIRLISFRAGSLPAGWYQLSGDKVLLTSYVGTVLNSLPDEFKNDWSIAVDGDYINFPDLFDDDGNGYFPRPVDGITRLVGSKQEDAIRDIQGESSYLVQHNLTDTSSANPFYGATSSWPNHGWNGSDTAQTELVFLSFKASNVVETASENRPKNIGTTPAMYLGIEA